jgi:adenylosuccinate lyase
MDGLRVLPENMRRNLDLSRGLFYSQRVLLALIDKGMDRTTAYKIVQVQAMKAWTEGRDFQHLLAADPDVQACLTPEELSELFDLGYHLRYVDVAFQRAGLLQPPRPTDPGIQTRTASEAPLAGSATR